MLIHGIKNTIINVHILKIIQYIRWQKYLIFTFVYIFCNYIFLWILALSVCPGSLQFWILTFCTPLTVNMFIFIGLSSCLCSAEGGSSIVLEVLLAGGFSIILFLFFPSCIKQEQQPNIRKRHVYLYDKRNFSLYTFLGKIYGPFIDTASGGITETVLSTLEAILWN